MPVADDSVILNRLVSHGPSPRLTSFKGSVGRNERSGSKVHVKALAPDRDSPVFPKVHRVRHVIILISNIALQNTEIDERSTFYGCVVLSVWRRDQMDVNVGAVPSLFPSGLNPTLEKGLWI